VVEVWMAGATSVRVLRRSSAWMADVAAEREGDMVRC
jgi:hypothetical protein